MRGSAGPKDAVVVVGSGTAVTIADCLAIVDDRIVGDFPSDPNEVAIFRSEDGRNSQNSDSNLFFFFFFLDN